MSSDDHIGFAFGSCEKSIVSRSVMAAVDQLCAATDVPVSLLDALEVPLSESLSALYPLGIHDAKVWVADGRLSVRIGVATASGDTSIDMFGEADALIRSFFDEIERPSDTCIELTASLT